MAYLILADALARAKERSGATSADDVYLSELLDLSSALDKSSVRHYRPFYVAARWLEQSRTQQALSEADGAKFTGLAKPIASLMELQAAYDASNELAVPKGFEAVVADQDSGSARSPRFGSGSFTPRLNP